MLKLFSFFSINSQLFGEEDPDQDVSPDTADPEAAGVYISSYYSSYFVRSMKLMNKKQSNYRYSR